MKFRFATLNDSILCYNWANDPHVRKLSFNSNLINYQDHLAWFQMKILNPKNSFYIFENENGENVGLVRCELEDNSKATIGIIIDNTFRGKGLSSKMIQIASSEFLNKNHGVTIFAYILKDNLTSFKSFLKAGFKIVEEAIVSGKPSYILTLN